MNENIITYIKDNYIKSEMEPKFAVLIKGDWGCGKTFLVKKILEVNYGKNYADKIIWLSVYGLSSIQQLRQKLFEKSHPILANKITKFVLETVKAGLKVSTNFDLNKDSKDDFSFDLAIPDFELEENGKKTKIKKLLILDDIERCSIPVSELFGFFSEEILEKNVRAIFISNDAKIKELNNDDKLNDYNSIKEKIIGMEFEVAPDVSSAVKSFIKEIRLEKNEAMLSEKVMTVSSNLNCKNLRSIRQAFVLICQIFDILEKEESSGLDENYISTVVEYFLVLFIQKANGKIEKEDDFLNAIEAYAKEHTSLETYRKRHEKDNYPMFRYAEIPLQDLYFSIIQKGDFLSELILEDYEQWTMPNDKRTPYQKLTHDWSNYSDAEFNNYYNAVQKEFDENKITDQYMIVGWADLKFELSEQGIILESIDDIKNCFLNYISLNKDKLIACDSSIPLGHGFTRCKTSTSALNEIKEALKRENLNLVKNKIKNRFIELYSSISENIGQLIKFIAYGEENSYGYPILSLIDIDDFYKQVKNCSYKFQVAICQSFEDRYGKNHNKETKSVYFPDTENIRKISQLYEKDTGNILMSPENARRKWLSEMYNSLYDYMSKFKKAD